MRLRVRWTGGEGASLVSWALVATQGVLFLAIALVPAAWGPAVPRLVVWGLVCGAAGGAAILAAALSLGPALTPLPEPNGEGLTARGIYRWVRHPMYSGVVLGFVGVAALRGASVAWILVAVLAVLFEFKTRREERFLVAVYPGYGSYAARTGKFVPLWGRRRA